MHMGSVLCSHPIYNFALSFSSRKLLLEKVLTHAYAHAWKHMFSCLTFWIWEREGSKWENFSLYGCNKMQVWLTVLSLHFPNTYDRMQCLCRFQELVCFVCALNSWFYQFVKRTFTDLGLRTMFLLHDKSKHPEFHQPWSHSQDLP